MFKPSAHGVNTNNGFQKLDNGDINLIMESGEPAGVAGVPNMEIRPLHNPNKLNADHI